MKFLILFYIVLQIQLFFCRRFHIRSHKHNHQKLRFCDKKKIFNRFQRLHDNYDDLYHQNKKHHLINIFKKNRFHHLKESNQTSNFKRGFYSKDELQHQLRFAQSQKNYEPIYFASASASQTYTDPATQKQMLASEALFGRVWKAKPVQGDQPQYWQGIFQKVQRIEKILILWEVTPYECQVDISIDGISWINVIDWRMSINPQIENPLPVIDDSKKTIYQKFAQYQQILYLTTPQYATMIKINMRNAPLEEIAISKVEVFTRSYQIQIKNMKGLPQRDQCLTVLGGNFKADNYVVTSDCVKAISNYDGRELFVLNTANQLQTFVNNLCLVNEDRGGIKLQTCSDAGHKALKIIYNYDETIQSINDKTLCLQSQDEEILIRNLPGLNITASNSHSDGNHDPENLFDNNPRNFWMSQPDVKHVTLEIFFDAVNIEVFSIYWKYFPSEFEIHARTEDFWRTIQHVKDNSDQISVFQMYSRSYNSIKILIKNQEALVNGKYTYAITQVTLEGTPLQTKMTHCNQLTIFQNLMNWRLYDASFSNFDAGKERSNQIKKTISETNELLDFVKKLKEQGPTITKIMTDAQTIKTNIKKLSEFLDFQSAQKNQFMQKYMTKKPSNIDGVLGSNSEHFGDSCENLRILQPYKKSGFYWIKSYCQAIPLRMYCDFQNNNGTYYYVGKSVVGENLGNTTFMTYKDIRKECADLGLEPIEIKSRNQLIHVKEWLMYMNQVVLNDQSFIPLGYDYLCDLGKCQGRYISMRSSQAYDASNIYQEFLNHKSMNEEVFDSIEQSKKDNCIGFGLNKDFLSTFKLGGSLPIKGMVCQLNPKQVEKFLPIDCSTIVSGNNQFDGTKNTNKRVYCPPGCAKKEEYPIYGTWIYRDDSSICRAGIHNQVIKDTGGFMIVSMEEGSQQYISSSSVGVTSLQYFGDKWKLSIIMNPYTPWCPINDFKDTQTVADANSFIQENSYVKYRDRNLQQQSQELAEVSQIPTQDISAQDPTQDAASSPIDQVIESIVDTSASGASSKTDSQKLPEENDVAEQNKKLIEKLDLQFKIDFQDLSKSQSLVFMVIKLNQQIQDSINALRNPTGDQNPTNQKIEIIGLDQQIDGLQTKFAKALSEAKQITRINQIKSNHPFVEDFQGELDMNYYQFDMKEVQHGPYGKWEFSQTGLSGHHNSIYQKSNVMTSKLEFASALIHKSKKYYDAEFQVAIMLVNSGCLDLMFRVRDEWNYYTFQVCKGEFGGKRLKSVINGKIKVLQEIDDGGVLEDKWYRVIIRYQRDNIEVRMVEESPSQVEKSVLEYLDLPELMKVNDANLVQGSFGFGVNELAGINLDHINLTPLKCTNELNEPDVIYLPIGSSHYKEAYSSEFSLIWQSIDPELMSHGPSKWGYKRRIEQKLNVISQTMKMYQNQDTQKGTISLLNIPKTLEFGVIKVQMFISDGESKIKYNKVGHKEIREAIQQSEGFIGVIFRYVDAINFMVFEVGNQVCRIRKFVDDVPTIVKENHCQMNNTKWYDVAIFVNQNQNVDVMMNLVGKPLQKVIEGGAESQQFNRRGKVGLLTHKETAYFAEFEMMTIQYYNDNYQQIENDKIEKQEIPEQNEIQSQSIDEEQEIEKEEKQELMSKELTEDERRAIIKKYIKKQKKVVDAVYAVELSNKDKQRRDNAQKKKEQDLEEMEALLDQNSESNNQRLSKLQEKEEEVMEIDVNEKCAQRFKLDQRQKWCQQKFEYQKVEEVVLSCQTNYCEICCQEAFSLESYSKPIKLQECVRVCHRNTEKFDYSTSWQSCIEKQQDEKSLYHFCEYNENIESKSQCKANFCKLCCTETQNSIKILHDDNTTNLCEEQCDLLFSNNNPNQNQLVKSLPLCESSELQKN